MPQSRRKFIAATAPVLLGTSVALAMDTPAKPEKPAIKITSVTTQPPVVYAPQALTVTLNPNATGASIIPDAFRANLQTEADALNATNIWCLDIAWAGTEDDLKSVLTLTADIRGSISLSPLARASVVTNLAGYTRAFDTTLLDNRPPSTPADGSIPIFRHDLFLKATSEPWSPLAVAAKPNWRLALMLNLMRQGRGDTATIDIQTIDFQLAFMRGA